MNLSYSSLEDDLRIIKELQNESWDINDPDVLDQLEKLQETYGSLQAKDDEILKAVPTSELSSPNFDDKFTILKVS